MQPSTIKSIQARQIFDSRGKPTIETEITTALGTFRACVPSGASTGLYEAVELRDKDKNNYLGQGVLKAVNNVNSILGPELIKSGLKVTEQHEIDKLLVKLDGTPNKGILLWS